MKKIMCFVLALACLCGAVGLAQEDFSFAVRAFTIGFGEEFDLERILDIPQDAEIEWSVEDESIAAVNEMGSPSGNIVLMAQGVGQTTLTAKWGDEEATVLVTVEEQELVLICVVDVLVMEENPVLPAGSMVTWLVDSNCCGYVIDSAVVYVDGIANEEITLEQDWADTTAMFSAELSVPGTYTVLFTAHCGDQTASVQSDAVTVQ